MYGDDKFTDAHIRKDRVVQTRFRKEPEGPVGTGTFRLADCLGDNASVEAAIRAIIGERGEILLWNPAP